MAGSNFDTTRLRLGDLLAAGSGAVLFISLFLDWYSVSTKGALGGFSAGGSAWDALSLIPIVLLLVSIIAIGVAVARMANATPRLPVSQGLLLLAAGALATILVLFRIIDIPVDTAGVPSSLIDVSRSFGIFVALIASLGVAAGGWITWNEEGRPKPNTAAVGAGAQPPYGGQPAGGQPAAGYGQQPAPGYGQQQAAAPPAAAAPAAAAPPPAAAAPPQQQAATPAPPPGGAADWYPDPRGEKRLRYWDGSQWTHHVAD
ncbi:MAG: hypothetical protein QOF37_676 [Thermoleophilaceae bacterium]|nr:hypothetical protein [Thermoleophilaceae bacterium]